MLSPAKELLISMCASLCTGSFPVTVYGDFLPRHVFHHLHALCAYIRCMYVALCMVLFWPRFDVIFADQVSAVDPVLKLKTSSKVREAWTEPLEHAWQGLVYGLHYRCSHDDHENFPFLRSIDYQHSSLLLCDIWLLDWNLWVRLCELRLAFRSCCSGMQFLAISTSLALLDPRACLSVCHYASSG